ncbi:MAG: hypothetical protein M3N24_11405 [Actinomycetota bacterium]|nr:hypothetical protein [Actinomycetota bacterium]
MVRSLHGVRSRWALPLALVAAAGLVACGGNGATTAPSPTAATSPSPAGGGVTDRASVEACLEDAGLDLAEGDTPLVSGVNAIGVITPEGGGLEPGDVSAAVFVFPSVADAQSEVESLEGFAGDVTQEGNIVVMWADISADARASVEGCIQAA